MESLITEREGMLALNKHREMQGFSYAYGEEAFTRVQQRFENLIADLRG
jgi:hypothetical protein